MSKKRNWRRIVARVLAGLVGLVFIMQGLVKFDPGGPWAASFERWGYPVWFRYLIGVIETAGGVALFVPRLTTYGAASLIVVMIGAAVTRLGDGRMGDVLSILVYILLLTWFAAEWRHRRWGGGGGGGEVGAA